MNIKELKAQLKKFDTKTEELKSLLASKKTQLRYVKKQIAEKQISDESGKLKLEREIKTLAKQVKIITKECKLLETDINNITSNPKNKSYRESAIKRVQFLSIQISMSKLNPELKNAMQNFVYLANEELEVLKQDLDKIEKALTVQNISEKSRKKLESAKEKLEKAIYEVETLQDEIHTDVSEYLEAINDNNEPTDETQLNLEALESELKEKYLIMKEEKQEENSQKNNKKKSVTRRIIAIALALGLLGTAYGIGKSSSKNSNTNYRPESPTTSEEFFDNQNTTPSVEIDEGFTDVTNLEQVSKRASEIEEELMPMLEKMNHDFKNKDLNNIITNIILVSNGELPIDENGNVMYDPNIASYYTQLRTELFGNYASSPQHEDKIYKVNYSMLTEDNSELSNFAAKYDKVYSNIAEARNNGDFDAFVESTKELGTLLYNDWVLQGMYEGNNPYNFAPETRLLALASSIERYASYVMEYEDGYNHVVCVPVCVNYNTGETKEIPVQSIFEAIVLGKSNDATLAVNAPDGYQVISEEFYIDLVNSLEYKYNNEVTLKLNK